jgi:protein arginine kinase activator
MHITEVLSSDRFEELHLCEECAHKALNEQPKKSQKPTPAGADEMEEFLPTRNACSVCGLKFVEFRNSGRLGCPHDYVEFREELLPLLENIHGEVRHAGKTPRRVPSVRKVNGELVQLRKLLQQAVNREAYEEAARIRDRIKQLEAS